MHWLTMKRAEETPAQWLYPTFQRLLDKKPVTPVEEIIDEFAHDATTFASFETQPTGSREATFFQRLSVLDVTTIYPLLLLLFRDHSAVLTPARRRRAVELLESWLVRRMLCRLTPKNYNRYFLELLRAVQEDVAHADDILYSELSSATAETNRWPEDAELTKALTTRSLYMSVPGARIVMVFGAIEQALRTSKSEQVALPANLTIEHVLPQKWQEHWSVGDDPSAVYERDIHVNRLGNLTLVTGSLNPSISNAAWQLKRPELRKHSLLLLNRDLCDENPNVWDEALIDKRSAALTSVVTRIWPGPDAAYWQLPAS
jgi:hypothetical protein